MTGSGRTWKPGRRGLPPGRGTLITRADGERLVADAGADHEVGPAGHLAGLIEGAGVRDVVAVQLLAAAAVGAHGPQRLDGGDALVDVLPSGVEEAAVVQHRRGEFAEGAVGQRAEAAAVGVHAVEGGGGERVSTAKDRPLAAGGSEDDAASGGRRPGAVGQVARVQVVGPVAVEVRVALEILAGAEAVAGDALGFVMYPMAENQDGWFDQYDPATFKYAISAREVKA